MIQRWFPLHFGHKLQRAFLWNVIYRTLAGLPCLRYLFQVVRWQKPRQLIVEYYQWCQLFLEYFYLERSRFKNYRFTSLFSFCGEVFRYFPTFFKFYVIYFRFILISGWVIRPLHAPGISRLWLTYKHYLFNGFLISSTGSGNRPCREILYIRCTHAWLPIPGMLFDREIVRRLWVLGLACPIKSPLPGLLLALHGALEGYSLRFFLPRGIEIPGGENDLANPGESSPCTALIWIIWRVISPGNLRLG